MPLLDRRTFATIAGASLASRWVHGQAKTPSPSITGRNEPELAPFDNLMTTFLEDHAIPGAALAITREGKLVYARGFGTLERDKKFPVQPASLFRIASVSKPITAVAVMQLAERKKFKLDDRVVGLMGLKPVQGRGDKLDERWKSITVRQCLTHSGGWDRDKSYDPITRPGTIAKAVGKGPPVPPADVVRYMMGQPLDFDPGEKSVYSNLGFLVLGRIIAATSGMNYEDYVRKEVFGKIGITRCQLGRALPENRAKGESRYHDSRKRTGECLYPPRIGQKVPLPDGGENFEAFEAHGGWIASAVDLVKFATAFDDPPNSPLLSAASIGEMWGKPKESHPADWRYGFGWFVRPVGNAGKVNAWHSGYIAGTEALLVRRWDGLNWAVLFNTNDTAAGKPLANAIDPKLHEAAATVKSWPETDQFPGLLK